MQKIPLKLTMFEMIKIMFFKIRYINKKNKTDKSTNKI